MNIYPEWWDDTITVFNKYEDPQTNIVTWYSHVITGCFWKYVGDKVTVGTTVLETNNVTCRIPVRSDYLDAYQWRELPNDSMSDYFTLSQGDIIILGDVSDLIDEYSKGRRSTDLIAKYKALQGCMEIERVANNTGRGRGQEHYFVRGI